MITPHELKRSLPLTSAADATVTACREAIARILHGRDPRMLVVVGPCSIHDTQAALDYADGLRTLTAQLDDTLLLVMRTYLEKPRTTVGWRGFVNDPHMDGSGDLHTGVVQSRSLLGDINTMGVPCATESLDPMLVEYTADLVSWTALGARTAESQVHRVMASGLGMPVGVKNTTDGSVQTAVEALEAIAARHTQLRVSGRGGLAVEQTSGNRRTHLVLRGGRTGPNFDARSVAASEQAMRARGLHPAVMIDCSHANSSKRAERQPRVLEDVAGQLVNGSRSIVGVMLESHLFDGTQGANRSPAEQLYGVSVTDACLGWARTASALRRLRERLAPVVERRRAEPVRAVA